jgi:5-methylcytosine-specific restriction endonuclease McrA
MKSKSKKYLRNKCDKICKELALKKANGKCLVCGSTFGVTAHHYFYRSSCSHLRFDLDNLIVLCMKCHARLHFRDPKLVEAQIIAKKGEKWLSELTNKALEKQKSSYQSLSYYQNILDKLNEMS